MNKSDTFSYQIFSILIGHLFDNFFFSFGHIYNDSWWKSDSEQNGFILDQQALARPIEQVQDESSDCSTLVAQPFVAKFHVSVMFWVLNRREVSMT